MTLLTLNIFIGNILLNLLVNVNQIINKQIISIFEILFTVAFDLFLQEFILLEFMDELRGPSIQIVLHVKEGKIYFFALCDVNGKTFLKSGNYSR